MIDKVQTHFNLIFSFVVMIALCLTASYYPQTLIGYVDYIKTTVIDNYGYLFAYSGGLLLVIELFLIFSKYGSIKVGDDAPLFDNISYWMLITACGIGVAPIFWSVLEPVAHINEGYTIQQTMMWTFHNWLILAGTYYGAFGVAFAFLSSKDKRWNVNSLFKSKVINHITNISIAISTAIGLALTFLYVVEIIVSQLPFTPSIWQVVMFVTFFTLVSSYHDIDKGVKTVAVFTIISSLTLIAVVYYNFNDYNLLTEWIKNWIVYLINEPTLILATGETENEKSWLATWSYNYFASWVSAAVFLGLMLANISKGRTIRSILIGSLFVPCIVCSLWFTVFGISAINSKCEDIFQLVSLFDQTGLLLVAIACLCIMFFVVQHDCAGIVLQQLTSDNSKKLWVIIIACLTVAISYIPGDAVDILRNITTVSSVPILVLVFFVFGKALYEIRRSYKQQNSSI